MLSVDIIKERLTPVFEQYGVKSATLFGSYAKGTADEFSDVDLVADTDLRGFSVMTLYRAIKDALGGIDLDFFALYEVIPGGRADIEIRKWGITIYEMGQKT